MDLAEPASPPPSPRGTKRKANDHEIAAPNRIRALHQDVVNKIAAGEIIVAPVHALKELIENAVDAGSTSLEILVKDGGLKLLQITDNGCGINRDDLPILCERFTTSKLKEFEDLQSIGTYGFRGEALASISHIAHLAVTTKTVDSSCAWKAHFSGGKLTPAKPGQSPDPKACAGKQGTQITVEDLFYNVPTRRRAFRSSSEEYAKIADMVGRYSVHCQGVAFSCKKHGEVGAGITVPANATVRDRIRMTHNSTVANELIDLETSSEQYGFTAHGLVSNANYSAKRTALLLFINNRSVESTPIKRAVEQTYASFLPKGAKPFVYLSLDIQPERVDVNVHPTKKEVHFLNEDDIIEMICVEIRSRLSKVDTSRTFHTQSLLSLGQTPTIAKSQTLPEGSTPTKPESQRPSTSHASLRKANPNNLIRTDAGLRKITAMLPQGSSAAHSNLDGNDIQYDYIDKQPTVCRLSSIKQLRAAVRENMHNELTDSFAKHTYVGIVDDQKRIAAVQDGVRLLLIDYGMVSAEYFYQVGLTDFCNFGTIRFNPPLSLKELLDVGAAQAKANEPGRKLEDWDAIVAAVTDRLVSRREMLKEYFTLEISEDGQLLSIPLLMKGYMPPLVKLPNFLLRLGPHVDWMDEKSCFHSFLRELAGFYAPESLPAATETKDEESENALAQRRGQLHRAVENLLFPAFRSRLVATKGLLSGTVEVANLKGLYRVFERC